MWQFIRKIGIEIYCFLTAPLVMKNCLGVLAVIGFVVLSSTWWMKCYTNHGESIQVPELVGISFRDAKKSASRNNLEVDITDSIYQVDKPAGLVVAQDPKPGSRVKENRTIYLTVTKNNPDLLKLPSLRGNDDYDRYAKTLQRMGLKPRIASTVVDEKLEPNTIVEVQYKGANVTRRIDAGGVEVNMGDFIDIVVSVAAEGMAVELPELTCMTVDAAREAIKSTGKSISTIHPLGNISSEENAYITRFNVNGNDIDVYVVQKKPADCPE